MHPSVWHFSIGRMAKKVVEHACNVTARHACCSSSSSSRYREEYATEVVEAEVTRLIKNYWKLQEELDSLVQEYSHDYVGVDDYVRKHRHVGLDYAHSWGDIHMPGAVRNKLMDVSDNLTEQKRWFRIASREVIDSSH